jgi:hypothetical protein
MGLDQYAYVAAKAGAMNEHYENYDYDKDTSTVTKPHELAYWRKHPNLQGWMESLWRTKKYSVQPIDASMPVDADSDVFNGIELELTAEDLDELERAVKNRKLPSTSGFFFGNDSDQHYYSQDLEFIKNARAELFMGLKVFYNSSW